MNIKNIALCALVFFGNIIQSAQPAHRKISKHDMREFCDRRVQLMTDIELAVQTRDDVCSLRGSELETRVETMISLASFLAARTDDQGQKNTLANAQCNLQQIKEIFRYQYRLNEFRATIQRS